MKQEANALLVLRIPPHPVTARGRGGRTKNTSEGIVMRRRIAGRVSTSDCALLLAADDHAVRDLVAITFLPGKVPGQTLARASDAVDEAVA